jgi:hypothetical protein
MEYMNFLKFFHLIVFIAYFTFKKPLRYWPNAAWQGLMVSNKLLQMKIIPQQW